MKEWAQEHGKPVRQRSARQETTKKKAGTLPLSMYKKPQPILDDGGLNIDDEDEVLLEEEEQDGDVNEIQPEEEEQEMVYDQPEESPCDFIDHEPSESESESDESGESEDNNDNSADAIPEQLRVLAIPRRASSRVVVPNSKYGKMFKK